MNSTTVHIINHTHWDREWFLTSAYTSRWIPNLIDRLEQLVSQNPDYQYLLDGQTLVIEDLLDIAPEYADRVTKLIGDGHLIVGPYYCQPDWQLVGGELLIRNLMIGQQDVARYHSSLDTGWLVDTFGHISQSPQIHHLFDIKATYVWRGTPLLTPYFFWQASDGSQLLTINLFGGYRNLYGVTHVPDIALKRLYAEIDKLRSFYPTEDIPLFDGYDLESNPEDPIRFYAQLDELDKNLELRESTPAAFAQEIAEKQLSLPIVSGELNSGKYGATFPGTLSTRTYLKILGHDCEHLLFQVCEPLATLARINGRRYEAAQYEEWTRMLLQNGVHDCICGVSIDQVHEKMEHSYRKVFDTLQTDIQKSLAAILQDFAPHDYAISTNPFKSDSWQLFDNHLVHTQTDGIGVWPINDRVPVKSVAEPIESFTWSNDYYTASVNASGEVRIDAATLGHLIVSEEHGDTYSDEPGNRLGVIQPTSSLTIVEKSAGHRVLSFEGTWRGKDVQVSVSVRLYFDQSPLLKWQIDLDTQGTDFRVDMVFKTAKTGTLMAGMPFDTVPRLAVDEDLLPRELSDRLAGVLLGQREIGAVSTFPFHDFVALSDDDTTIAILSRGIRAYRADETGTVMLTLRRSVEWLTKADLKNRVGDAGPFFYVPDARSERMVRHEVAVAIGSFSPDSVTLQSLNAAYQNPPLIVHGNGSGTRTTWQLMQENVPMSSLQIRDGAMLARLYNPTSQSQALSRTYIETDVWGNATAEVDTIPPKRIITLRLAQNLPEMRKLPGNLPPVISYHWRVGANKGSPDPVIFDRLEERITRLNSQLSEIETQLEHSEGKEQLLLQHRYYVLKRTQLEFQLSLLLNKRKLTASGIDHLYHPDEEIAALGLELNQLRTKRRVFDYVVQALGAV